MIAYNSTNYLATEKQEVGIAVIQRVLPLMYNSLDTNHVIRFRFLSLYTDTKSMHTATWAYSYCKHVTNSIALYQSAA